MIKNCLVSVFVYLILANYSFAEGERSRYEGCVTKAKSGNEYCQGYLKGYNDYKMLYDNRIRFGVPGIFSEGAGTVGVDVGDLGESSTESRDVEQILQRLKRLENNQEMYQIAPK